MKTVLLVGAGSFLGGVARYLLSLALSPRLTGLSPRLTALSPRPSGISATLPTSLPASLLAGFPTGTLVVNIVGCFCIGIVFGLFDRGGLSLEWRMFLATGFLGGFTTFSAFSNETFTLFRDGQPGCALLYVAASLILGLLATWGAYQITR